MVIEETWETKTSTPPGGLHALLPLPHAWRRGRAATRADAGMGPEQETGALLLSFVPELLRVHAAGWACPATGKTGVRSRMPDPWPCTRRPQPRSRRGAGTRQTGVAAKLEVSKGAKLGHTWGGVAASSNRINARREIRRYFTSKEAQSRRRSRPHLGLCVRTSSYENISQTGPGPTHPPLTRLPLRRPCLPKVAL